MTKKDSELNFTSMRAEIVSCCICNTIHRPSILHPGQVIRQSMRPVGICHTCPQLSETGLTEICETPFLEKIEFKVLI